MPAPASTTAPPDTVRRPLPKAAKALVLALISALAGLAALEVAVRLADLDVSREDSLRHHPRFGWTLNPANRTRDGVNDLGFRHPPVPVAKPAGMRRLVILGDSFAQGTAYPYRATFAGLLGEWLGGSGERWQIVNLGISGWGTGQQYLALREIGMAYEPDVVVLQTLPFNDLCNNSRALAHTCDTEDSYRPYFELDGFVLEVDAEGSSLRRTWDQPWRARLRRSALFRLLERRVPALGPPAPEAAPDPQARSRALVEFHRHHAQAAGLDHRVGLYTLLPEERQPPAMREAWAVTERLVEEIAGLTGSAGVPLIAVAVPFADAFDSEWLARAGRPGRWPRGPEGAPLDPALGTERMERLLAGRATVVIPMQRRLLAGPMAPADHFYPYGRRGDRHLSALGHHRLAAWIVDELRRLGLTAAEPPGPSIESVDLLSGAGHPVAERELGRLAGAGAERFRPAQGPASRLAFHADRAEPMRLRLAARPRGGTRAIKVVAGETAVGVLELTPGGTAAAEIPFTAVAGRNELRLVYRGWRAGEGRVAAEVTELVLERDPPARSRF